MTDDNITVKNNIGAFVQGLSRGRVTVTAEAKYDAAINNKAIVVGGVSTPENTPILLPNTSPLLVDADVIDSRGLTASKTVSFTTLPYSPPGLVSGTSWSVERVNSSDVPDPLGVRLRASFSAIATTLKVSDVEKNSLAISIRTRVAGTGEAGWTARNNIPNGGLAYSTPITISGGDIYTVDTSYDVELTIADKTGSKYVLITTVPTGLVALDLNENGVGVGKYHEQGALDVGGDVYASGKRLLTIDEALPAGTIVSWTADVIPDNWLSCDGSAVSRTLYSDLFAIIGVRYGTGDGSTTFNVPDLRGRAAVGKSSDSEFNELGKVFGTKTHTLTIAEMPSHTHTQNAHTHGQTIGWGAGSTGGGYGRTDANSPANWFSNVGATAAVNQSTGGSDPHNNIQPSIALNYIIRAVGGIGALTNTVESVLLDRVANVETKVNYKLPAFSASMTTDQTWSGTTTHKKVLFNTALLDNQNCFDTSLSRFVVPVDGLYEFDGHLTVITSSGGPAIEFRVNGAQTRLPYHQFLAYSNAYDGMHWSDMFELKAGDYVEVWMSNPNNTTITTGRSYGIRFSGKLLQSYPV